MDKVHEANSSSGNQALSIPHSNAMSQIEQSNVILRSEVEAFLDSRASSRRPSAIIAALRRPSQAVALSAAQAIMNHRRYMLGLYQGQSERSLPEKQEDEHWEQTSKKHIRHLGDDALTTILSALYAKLLVVLGIAFPITEVLSTDVTSYSYQGFYLYLYLGSISFVVLMYGIVAREKAVCFIVNSYSKNDQTSCSKAKDNTQTAKYGSLYLRLGAIAFGIGSMVYSGLEFGRYFEMRLYSGCISNILHAITPATRMILTLLQMQFIFLSSKNVELHSHKILARFGIMHMVATNLCEWLYVIVEETKHEIIHIVENYNFTNTSIDFMVEQHCNKQLLIGSLVSNSSPFLFPCKIEYSLICAVILYEMWKNVNIVHLRKKKKGKEGESTNNNQREERLANILGEDPTASQHHFTVDCSKAHKGLFGGIMIIVLTIISLIMFYVLTNKPRENIEKHKRVAEFQVNIVELMLYVISSTAVIVAMAQMREMKYHRKVLDEGYTGIGLDNTLLVVAQTGMFIYSMFSIIGYFPRRNAFPIGFITEIFSFIQTCLQTVFVLDGWWRRCRTLEQTKRKPGRELITFLIVANMAMWSVNTLEKNRAGFRQDHLKFFGIWAWTIITHISMPLAIFYRFHSTICLFEIWKSAYKFKSPYKLLLSNV